jgi:cytochrome c553
MKPYGFFIVILALTACSAEKTPANIEVSDPKAPLAIHPGKDLMQNNCYVCHNPSAPEDGPRIAPPMAAIKAHYINENTSKEAFTKSMVDFLNEPTEEKARLKGAVKRFGLMPYQKYSETTITQIAEYMYDYEIAEPDWFKDHFEKNDGKPYRQRGKKMAQGAKTAQTYTEIGMEYALATKQLLGKNLMGAIQSNGTLHALEFCNVQAMPLTDSMSTAYNATIKRVSDRNRNPNNKASNEEIAYILKFSDQIADGLEPEPITVSVGSKIHFYYPIVTNTMCLKCHGKTEQMESEVVSKITALYPDDKAVGYKENEVRGIWSISFELK